MPPQLSRRQFLKSSLLATGGMLLPATTGKISAEVRKFPLHKKIGEARTVYPYCSVGCGMVIATDDKVTSSTVKATVSISSIAAHSTPNRLLSRNSRTVPSV